MPVSLLNPVTRTVKVPVCVAKKPKFSLVPVSIVDSVVPSGWMIATMTSSDPPGSQTVGDPLHVDLVALARDAGERVVVGPVRGAEEPGRLQDDRAQRHGRDVVRVIPLHRQPQLAARTQRDGLRNVQAAIAAEVVEAAGVQVGGDAPPD